MPKSRNPSANYSVEIRRGIWEDQGRLCHYCDKKLNPPGTKAGRGTHLDHKVPKSATEEEDLSNLIICCRQCNMRKGKKSYEDFIQYELTKLTKAVRRLSKLKAQLQIKKKHG